MTADLADISAALTTQWDRLRTWVAPLGDDLVLATDLDHDGHADTVTRLGADGVVTSRYGPDGRVESHDHPWGAPAPPSVDPRTGEWTRG